jgi:AcrR family transcriptional regulator
MSMSIPYELSGRTQQKARTRAALVAAARELLGEGTTPTVEQAADRAAISRTTAYRYFRNRRELLIASYPELQEASLLGDDPPADPAARLEVVTRSITRQVVEHEPELRAMLRMSLETPRPDDESLPLRRGRAIDWIEDALSPLRDRMHERELHRLALAIRAAIGIEALVWLTDVGGLSRGDAVDLMRSSARALLQAAVAGADGDRR